MSIDQTIDLLQKLRLYDLTHKLEHYQPYDYQHRFHYAEGYQTPGVLAQTRALMAGNGVGKTICGAMEDALHATGRYPAQWKGHKFRRPVTGLIAGYTNESVRDILQKALLGQPGDDKQIGTGTIPRECVGKFTRKAGVPDAVDSVRVRHFTDGVFDGWSKLMFRCYEQGPKKFMGTRFDFIHPDEEPPPEIWSQIIRGTLSIRDAIIYLTFTPENGMTEVVNGFMNNLQRGQAIITATWDDAPHMTPEHREQKLKEFPEHEREMRSKGVPLMGQGLVFPFPDENIVVDDMEIPRHWPQIIGIDFGWDHPFAAVRLAWNRDSDCIYVVSEYAESKQLPPVHAAAINAWGGWQPVAWPHDGLNTEKGTGDELVKQYRDARVNLLPEKATNPPRAGVKEGDGGNSPEAAILEMYERMAEGRWKVFKSCQKWLTEKRQYHRKDGKLVKLFDDVISASRHAAMMLRHSRTEVIKRRQQPVYAGATNW